MKIQSYSLALIVSLTLSSITYAEETVLKAELKTGSPILVSINPAQPRQSVNLVFRSGLSQINKNLHGAMGLYLDLLEEGPKNIPAEEYKKKLYLKNASISFSATPRALYASITAPQEHLGEVLSLAKQTWMSPKLENSLFEHIKTVSIQQALAELKQS